MYSLVISKKKRTKLPSQSMIAQIICLTSPTNQCFQFLMSLYIVKVRLVRIPAPNSSVGRAPDSGGPDSNPSLVHNYFSHSFTFEAYPLNTQVNSYQGKNLCPGLIFEVKDHLSNLTVRPVEFWCQGAQLVDHLTRDT